jgi:hypothetical protein
MLRDMQREDPDVNSQWQQLEDAPNTDPPGTKYLDLKDEASLLKAIGESLAFGEVVE